MPNKIHETTNQFQEIWDFTTRFTSVTVAISIAIWFLLTSFMTVSESDKANASVREYIDQKVQSQNNKILRFETTLDRIDQRVWLIVKEKEGQNARKKRDREH